MSPQFVFQFIRRFPNRGSALPLALGIGLMMSLVAATMMVRSSNDQIHAASQAQASESLAVAEAGIARTIELLNQYPDLLNKEAADWDIATDTSKLTCDLQQDTNEVLADKATLIANASGSGSAWIELEETDTSISEFRIVDFDPETGILKVEGRKKANNGSATLPEDGEPEVEGEGVDTNVQANSILEVKVVQQTPGLWALGDDGSTPLPPGITVVDGIDVNAYPPFEIRSVEETEIPYYLVGEQLLPAGKINANIWVGGCSYDENELGEDVFIHDGDQIRSLSDGATPKVSSSLEPRPPLPVPPPNSYVLPPTVVNYCYITLPRIPRPQSNTNCHLNNPPEAIAVEGYSGVQRNFPDLTQAEQAEIFNRTDDQPVNGVYSYVFKNLQAENLEDNSYAPPPPNSDGIHTNRALNINNGQVYIDPLPGTKVVIYVEGDLRIGTDGLFLIEAADLDENSAVPSCEGTLGNSTQNLSIASYLGPRNHASNQLEVYLADGSGSWGGDFQANIIEMGNRSLINGLVYAPSATTYTTGGQIRGAVWSKKFHSTPSKSGHALDNGVCNIAVAQQDVGDNLLVEIPKRLSAIVAWRRQSQ